MSTPTKKQLLDLHERIAVPIDLRDRSASAAAHWLADNWAHALEDGASIETLLHDVDTVALVLQEWKATLAAKFSHHESEKS